MSKLQQSLQAGQFTFTGEVGPPKGVDIHHVHRRRADDEG